jgi:glycosyltransferase involved in cell wall biosynthesis
MGVVKIPLGRFEQWRLDREQYPPVLEFRHVRCVSRYVRDRLVQSGSLPDTAGVLYNGIDPIDFCSPSTPHHSRRDLKLVYCGRLIRDKGVHTAIEAIHFLRDMGQSASLAVIGSGHPAYEKELHHMVEEFDLKDSVDFIPRVERTKLPAILGQFDVLLFTSIWPEPLARSVMEAMSLGLLVVGTDVGGQPELLRHGCTGLTYRPEDAQGLAELVREAARSPDLRTRLARAGQQFVHDRFTLARMVEEFLAYLRNEVVGCGESSGTQQDAALQLRSNDQYD